MSVVPMVHDNTYMGLHASRCPSSSLLRGRPLASPAIGGRHIVCSFQSSSRAKRRISRLACIQGVWRFWLTIRQRLRLGIGRRPPVSDDRWARASSVDLVILSDAKNLSPGMHAGRLAIPSPIRHGFAWECDGSSDVCHVCHVLRRAVLNLHTFSLHHSETFDRPIRGEDAAHLRPVTFRSEAFPP